MKKLTWIIIIGLTVWVFMFFQLCEADLYVIFDKETCEIYTVAPKDDTVVPEGCEKAVLLGTWENYEFDENPTDYKFKNKKFIKNIDKIDKREKKRIEDLEKKLELEEIEKQMRKIAQEQLEAEGLSFKYY